MQYINNSFPTRPRKENIEFKYVFKIVKIALSVQWVHSISLALLTFIDALQLFQRIFVNRSRGPMRDQLMHTNGPLPHTHHTHIHT